jgi:23S rRNA pseudouridine1911/1915/1917 synthase
MSEPTTLSSRIFPGQEGQNLIDFLSSRFRYHTRPEWEGIIREGGVTVNNECVSPDRTLLRNDIVSYTVVLCEPPVDDNIRILHEEESFLIADKPGNIPSHSHAGFIKNTFIYILRGMLADRGYGGPVKLVHRLDRETSGLMLVAKSDDAHRALSRQFEKGSVEKEYLAVARGVIAETAFEIGGAIARDPSSGISIRKRVVPRDTSDASPALTRFEVVERLDSFTLVRCIPSTGRTNQIRIHLAHAGHPVAGDKLYGRTDEEFLSFVKLARAGRFDTLPFLETKRHMLHASGIGFSHPVRGGKVRFVSPIPEDMQRFLESRRNDAAAAHFS